MIRRTFLKIAGAFGIVAALMSSVPAKRWNVRRWTMKPSIHQGELCRYIGWTDSLGIHVAIKDAYDNPMFSDRERWMIRPPEGQTDFGDCAQSEDVIAANANDGWRYYGAGAPYHAMYEKKVTPSFFDELWNGATPIDNCDECCSTFHHYMQGVGG